MDPFGGQDDPFGFVTDDEGPLPGMPEPKPKPSSSSSSSSSSSGGFGAAVWDEEDEEKYGPKDKVVKQENIKYPLGANPGKSKLEIRPLKPKTRGKMKRGRRPQGCASDLPSYGMTSSPADWQPKTEKPVSYDAFGPVNWGDKQESAMSARDPFDVRVRSRDTRKTQRKERTAPEYPDDDVMV